MVDKLLEAACVGFRDGMPNVHVVYGPIITDRFQIVTIPVAANCSHTLGEKVRYAGLGGAVRGQGEPGGAQRSQEGPGGTRKSQGSKEEPG